MSKLEELIQELCPDGVEFRSLVRCCNVLDNKRKPVTKAAREAGVYPYYGANGIQDYVSDYIFDGTFVLVGEDGSVITKAGTPVVTWAEGKIWVNNHAHIVEEIEGVQLRYLFHFIQTVNVTPLIHGNIPKLTGGDFKAISIPVPPLPVQEEIVRILDNFTELTVELTAELTARKKQYYYYHRLLFEFSDEIPVMKLGDVCELTSGGDVPKEHWSKELTDEYFYPIYSNGLDNDGLYGYTDIPRINKPSVTIAGRGAGVGNAIIRRQPYFPIIRLVSAVPKENLDVDYLYYCIKLIEFKIPQGGIPQLTVPMVASYEIPVPDIEMQIKIAKVLNSFERIINDMSLGIPAEIEARTKQYEYYRDKLLSFDRVEAII